MTRPNIAYVVHVVSQFMHAPCTSHLNAVKRIFSYLWGSSDHGLWFHANSRLDLICDSDWASCLGSYRSTTGFAVFWILISSPGNPRNSPLSPAHLLKLNVVLPPTLLLKFSGFVSCFLTSAFWCKFLFDSSMITSPQDILLPILFFTVAANISRWTNTLFARWLLVVIFR